MAVPPLKLTASSIGSVALARAFPGAKGRVHSVFDRAINLLLPGGLVFLVGDDVARGPLNLTLETSPGASLADLGVSTSDPVTVEGTTLELGDGRVQFGSSAIYSPGPKLARPVLENPRIVANAEVARNTAIAFGNMAGLGGLLGLLSRRPVPSAPSGLNMFASAALGRAARLEDALTAGDGAEAERAAADLVGLGPGLTPSSDDMLAGMALVCAVHGENSHSSPRATGLVGPSVLAAAPGRTTTLSTELLLQAALGRGNEAAMGLCDALLTGGLASVQRETRRVAAIGETSGTDAVLGMILGARLCADVPMGLARRAST